MSMDEEGMDKLLEGGWKPGQVRGGEGLRKRFRKAIREQAMEAEPRRHPGGAKRDRGGGGVRSLMPFALPILDTSGGGRRQGSSTSALARGLDRGLAAPCDPMNKAKGAPKGLVVSAAPSHRQGRSDETPEPSLLAVNRRQRRFRKRPPP